MDAAWLETQFRLNPDKSKADLARTLALEPPAVSKMLTGKRQIKAHEYVAMRRFFGLPVDGQRAVEAANAYVLAPLTGMQEGDDESWVMPASLFEHRTKAAPDKIRIFEVHGDAMLPDFKPGEHVLVDLSDARPAPAGEFVVFDGHGHIIRLCEYVPHSEPPQVRLSAHNGKYQPYVLPLEKAQIAGRVIAKLQWL